MQEIMTAKQLAGYLQLNEITIYKWVRLGEIPVVKLGRVLRFKKEIIDKWLAIESGWDPQFQILLKNTQEFGKKAGITETKIQRAIEEVRSRGR